VAVKRVRKRDGREEGFDPLRLADSLRAALAAAELSPDLAGALADAIAVSIEEAGPVESAALAGAAETALQQCGTGAAEAYRNARRTALARIARLRVHTREEGRDRARPFDRERLSLSLVRERYLERNTAARVARQVEHRLADAGHHHVTGALVHALADNECRTLGLRGSSQSPKVDSARRELMAWLGGDMAPGREGQGMVLGGENGDLRPLLGERVLASFAREEILTEDQSVGLDQGIFDLPGLGDWTRPARVRLFPTRGEDEGSFWERVGENLPRCGEVQVHWPGSRESVDPAMAAPFQGFIARKTLRLSTAHPDLAMAWAATGTWIRIPARAFLQFPSDVRHELAASGCVLLTWQPARHASARASCPGEDVLDSCAVLNLSSPALRAGPGGEAAFMADCGEAAAMACRSMGALSKRGRGKGSPRACLLPAGLGEAAGIMMPASMSRFLLGIRQTLDHACREAGLRPAFDSPPHSGGAGRQLAQASGREGALAVGWRLEEEIPIKDAFDAFPWLEFPAPPSLEGAAWVARLRSSTLA